MPVSQIVEDLTSKVLWAEQHLGQLQDVISNFRAMERLRVSQRDEPLNGRHVLMVESSGLAPTSIALLLSDFVYATRSTLDHLAWQLARLTTRAPSRRVQFPVHENDSPTSEKIFSARTEGIPRDAVDEIRAVQPYRRGAAFREDPLWKLNELSNIDKHRLFAVSSNAADVFVHPKGYAMRTTASGVEFSWRLPLDEPVVFEPYAREFMFGEPLDSTGPRFEVRQSELAGLLEHVRHSVLPRFERFF